MKVSTFISRVDGRLKVTGGAKYASDHTPAGLTYGIPIVSTIARGSVKAIDSSRAEGQPGFLACISRRNAPELKPTANDFGSWTKLGKRGFSLRTIAFTTRDSILLWLSPIRWNAQLRPPRSWM